MRNHDFKLHDDVCHELEWEPEVNAAHIGAAAEDGVVTLMGHVDSLPEKVAAERAARRVKGVRAIVQEIEVRLPEHSRISDVDLAASIMRTLEWDNAVPHDRIGVTVEHGIVTLEGTVERAFERDEAELDVRKISGVNGVINKIVVRPTERSTPSAEEIQRALQRSGELDASVITIKVTGNRVMMTGQVRRWSERHAAERIAWSARGVREVDNRLTVEAL
jgi:osmotically-inducible protein OsmY